MSEAKQGEPSSGEHFHTVAEDCDTTCLKSHGEQLSDYLMRALRDEGEPAGHWGTESQTCPVWSAGSTVCPFVHVFLQHTCTLNVTRHKT